MTPAKTCARTVAFAAAVAFAAVGVRAGELVLARRGAAADCTIVLRPDAHACERRAAEELQTFLRRQTGVSLAISTNAVGKAICLAPADGEIAGLGDEGFRLRAAPPHLRVEAAPGGRGALYGVCELLERFGGCAWYSTRFEHVPEIERFAVPDDLDERQVPAFKLRSTTWNGFGGACAFAARNKLNDESFPDELGGSAFRFDRKLGKCHTFEVLLPVAEYFDAHPEYFAEIDGRRQRFQSQLCLTNPDVLEICTRKVLERIAVSRPLGVTYYGVSQNDWMNACRCATCAALNRRERSLAATQLDFVNRLAERVEKVHPDVVIQTLAYAYTRRPPATLVPRANVQVCLCTIECDFSRALDESRAIENRRVAHDFAVWARGKRPLSVWDYSSDYACYLHPWPDFSARRRNIAFYRDHGVDQLFELCHGGGANDVWNNLRCWLIAKWMWNPDLDEEALWSRCLRDHFGAEAAPLVREAIRTLETQVRNAKLHPMRCFESIHSPAISDAALDRAAALFDRAAVPAAADPVWRENLRLARLPLDFSRAVRGAARPSLSRAPVDAAKWRDHRDAARRVRAAMCAPGGLRFADDLAGNVCFSNRICALAAREAPPDYSRCLALEETHLTGDFPATVFRYVDDAEAGDGRAVMLDGKTGQSIAWLDFASLALDRGGRYVARVRVKGACRAGVYNLRRERSSLCVAPKATGAYRWHTLGEFTPVVGDRLWIVLPFAETDDGEPTSVWIDAVEIVRVR